MKKSSTAFAVIFALAIVYAALSSRISLTALLLTGGKMHAIVYAIFFAGVNCVFALLVGIFAGIRPWPRCWAVLPAPVVLVAVYRLITGTNPILLYFCALAMLGVAILGLESAAIVRILQGRNHEMN